MSEAQKSWWKPKTTTTMMYGRAAAAFIGLLGAICSIGLLVYLIFFAQHFNAKSFCIILLALNFVACIRWLQGIIKKNTIIMVVPLVWWSILLILWILAALYFHIRSAFDGHSNVYDTATVIIALILTLFYIGAITSFIAMKNEAYRGGSKVPATNVSFNSAKESSGLLAQRP